jgi:hypothetical protein
LKLFTAVVTSYNEPSDSTLSGSEKVGIIAGSALGGFAFILLLLAGALVYRRYRRREVIAMRKAVPTPRRVRLEDEDEMDLFDPEAAFLGRPIAPSGSIFQERVWPSPSSRLEDPLRTTHDLNLSSVVDDVMGQPEDSQDQDATARLLSSREHRFSGSSYRPLRHSGDASLASNHSDTPLLSRPLLPNWQNGSRVTFADDALASRTALKAQEVGNHRPLSTPSSNGSGLAAAMETRSSVGSNMSSYSDASMMRSRGTSSHEPQLLVDTTNANQVREIPPLYHTIIPDPLPPSVDDDNGFCMGRAL